MKDSTTRDQLRQIAMNAVGVVASTNGVLAPTAFTEAAAPKTVAFDPTDGFVVHEDGAPSLTPGHVSVAVSLDGTKAGLAMMSPTKSCAVVGVTGTAIRAELWKGDHRDNCRGQAALDAVDQIGRGDSDPGPAAEPLDKPQNLTATVTGSEVQLTWDAVDDATGYLVHIDGKETATQPGNATTLTIPATSGTHQVTVTATGESGSVSEASDPATYTVPCDTTPANDDMGCAAELTTMPNVNASVSTPQQNTQYAGFEAGETEGQTLWWKFTPTVSATFTLDVAGSGLYARPASSVITVYTDATTATDGTVVVAGEPAAGATARFHGQAGTTYWIQVNSSGNGRYVLRLTRGGANDNFTDAAVLGTPAPNAALETGGVVHAHPGTEPGEVGDRTLWLQVTPDVSGTLTASVVGFGTYGRPASSVVSVYTDATTATDGTVVAESAAAAAASARFHVDAGTTYWVRVSSTPDGRYSLRLQRGEDNDDFAAAAELADPGSGATVTSPSRTPHLSGVEPGESGTHTLWWKVTPQTPGTFRFSLASYALFYLPESSTLTVYRDATTALNGVEVGAATASQPQVAVPVEAGVTYWVRVDPIGSMGGNHKYVTKVARIA